MFFFENWCVIAFLHFYHLMSLWGSSFLSVMAVVFFLHRSSLVSIGWVSLYEGGKPPKWNYLLEGEPLVIYKLPPLGECSRNPSVSVYQLALLWEAAFCFSEFFLKTLSTCLPISWWVVIYESTPCWVFSSFWLKMAWPLCFTLPIHPFSPGATFVLFPRMKKVLKGKHFANVEEAKQKNGRSTKRHQNQQVQKLLSSGKKKSL